jgi:DNA-binding CsgD family transcriptional regulator
MEDDPFVRAVEAIYTAAPDPGLWPMALQAIADVFSDVGAILMWRRDDGKFGVMVSPRLEGPSREYALEWAQQDIRAARRSEHAYHATREAIADHHVLTAREIETHPFYTQFLARHGLKWSAATALAPDPHVMAEIRIERAPERPPYSEPELDLLSRLGRHAETAGRLSIRLLNAELADVGMRNALSRLGVGVFALDGNGRVVFKNEAGERLLGGGLRVTDGRLRVASTAGRGGLEQALAAALGEAPRATGEPKPVMVEREGALRPLALYVLPITAQVSAAQAFLAEARALVLAIDPQADAPPEPALVRDILGLTLAEARVAALVGSGVAPREAAGRLGISEATVRTALKRVFDKVGVSRQSELAALLTRLVLR